MTSANTQSASERQLRDVRGMLDVHGDSLDRAYLARWAAELGIGELWERVANAH